MRMPPVWNAVLVDVGNGRQFLRDLGRGGSGAREIVKQALKAGLAAVAAWAMAVHVLGLPLPYIAPWAALVMVRTTVYWSVLTAARQVTSVSLGVVLAYVVGVASPTTELALAVLVPVTVLAGRWDRLGDQGLYVPFTALFMVTIGGVDGPYLLSRLAETALGVGIGTTVNLLVFPPVRVRTVGDADRRTGEEVQATLRDMAEGLRGEWDADDTWRWADRADRLDDHVWEVRRALRHGRESLRFNPRLPRRTYASDVDRYRTAIDLLGRTAETVQSIANTLRQDERVDVSRVIDAAFGARYASVLDAAADVLGERLAELLPYDADRRGDAGPSGTDPSGVLEAMEHDIDPRLAETAAAVELKGALLVAARRLLGELSR